MHSALLGFTKLNNAHNGRRLGGALFKTIDRLGLAHRVRESMFLRITTNFFF